jgi:uncharacterized protein YbaR (Trm112 family)
MKEPAIPEPLVCPISKTRLRRDGDFMISEAGYRYPIKDGIPILLPGAAIKAPAAAALDSESSPSPIPGPGNRPG